MDYTREELVNRLSKLKIEYELLKEEYEELEKMYFEVEKADYEIALIIGKMEYDLLIKERDKLLLKKNELEEVVRKIYEN